MIRIGLAVAIATMPVTAALAQATHTSQNAQRLQTPAQRQPAPGRLTIPVAATIATTSTGARPDIEPETAPETTATLSIQRFARTTDNGIAAVGTLTVSVADRESEGARTIVTQVAMPVARPAEGVTPTEASDRASGEACQTLALSLGPIDVTAAGLPIHVDAATLVLTAVPGASERLRTLLCEVSGTIGNPTSAADLLSSLNAVLDMVG